jgi:hypothetical protein
MGETVTEENVNVQWKKCRNKPLEREYAEITEPITIKTREGTLVGYPESDYLMRGVSGEIYPIKKEIFHKTYDTI